MFDRLLARLGLRGPSSGAARSAEARGDLARAVELWTEADEPAEAARVMLLRGDAESEARVRLVHYTQAAATAPEGHDVRREAVRKRAELVVAMSADAALSAVARNDLLAAAADLEGIGEAEKAAGAYALAGNVEGEARALASAGDVDRLEYLLSTEQAKERDARKRADASAEIDVLAASGRRREALEAAEGLARARPDDLPTRERALGLKGRRAMGPLARLTLKGRALPLVLGDELVIGRSVATLNVSSTTVSRRHLRIARADGSAFVEDLGSDNGTFLHGMRIAGRMPVGEGIELKLGAVSVRVAPSTILPGAVEIDVAGEHWVAPLGPAALGVGAWRVESAADGWLELVSGAPPAFLGSVELAARTTLFAGDKIADVRGGPPVLEVGG